MYVVIKTVKGRRYLYQQRTWREGRRVRTESRYIGPLDGAAGTPSTPRTRKKGPLQKLGDLIAANTLSPEERARVFDEDALVREEKERQAARDKARADFEEKTGLKLGPRNPTPQEKHPSPINSANPVASPQTTPVASTDKDAVDGEPGQSQPSERSTEALDVSGDSADAGAPSTPSDGGEGQAV